MLWFKNLFPKGFKFCFKLWKNSASNYVLISQVFTHSIRIAIRLQAIKFPMHISIECLCVFEQTWNNIKEFDLQSICNPYAARIHCFQYVISTLSFCIRTYEEKEVQFFFIMTKHSLSENSTDAIHVNKDTIKCIKNGDLYWGNFIFSTSFFHIFLVNCSNF